MKYIYTYLLTLSVALNIFLLLPLLENKKESDEKMKLRFWKDINHKDGYRFFVNKIKTDYPEINLTNKECLVYFWDSTSYDFLHANAMRGLDSMAAELGQYTFNYIFVTEMEETSAKYFLTRNGANYKNFKILGGMDDFMSGVYTEKPVKWRTIGPKPDSTKTNSECPDMSKMKIKGYYLLMDGHGNILYHNYKNILPFKDTALMRRLNTVNPIKKLDNLN